MVIKIEDLPSGQKIKNISFNISFEDETEITKNEITPIIMPKVSSPKDNTTVFCSTPQIDTSKTTGINVAPKVTADISTVSSSTLNIPDIPIVPTHDISTREAKIDEAMMKEEF